MRLRFPGRAPARSLRLGAATLPLVLALTGCAEESMDDLLSYRDAVLARSGPPLTPLCVQIDCGALAPAPDRPTFEGRSPFQPFVLAAAPMPPEPTPMPDPHPKEELERYALDSLRMLGSITRGAQRWALLRAPDGIVHRIRIGNYVGLNNGRVIAVDEARVSLSETVWSDARGWEDRAAEIALPEG